jgi:hypothetical protein
MDSKPLWTCEHIRLKRCREGAMIYNINDRYIGRALDKYGEISHDEVLFLQQLIRPGMTVLDLGANIGLLTVPVARLVHPGGKVIAFEPQRIVYQMLCGNLALNAIESLRTTAGSVAPPASLRFPLWTIPNRTTSVALPSAALGQEMSSRLSRSILSA